MSVAKLKSEPEGAPRSCLVIGGPHESGVEGAAIESAGFACVRAHTVQEAATALHASRPAFVLVHEQVASRDGAGIFSAIREHQSHKHLPVMLLASQHSSPELLEAAWKAGVDDCILQPLTPKHIQEVAGAIQGATSPAFPIGERRAVRQVAISGDAGAYGWMLCDHLEHEGLHLLHLDRYQGPPQPVDLLVHLTDSDTDLERGLSFALERISPASPGRVLPILALSRGRQWSNTEGARKDGIYLLDGERPLEDVVRAICGLLKRAPHRLRADQRVPFFSPVLFREMLGTTSNSWRSGFTYNLSAGGLFIKSLVPLRTGARVEVRICLTTTGEQLDVAGVVAWSNPYTPRGIFTYPVGMGIQFLGIVSRKMAQLIDSCRSSAGL